MLAIELLTLMVPDCSNCIAWVRSDVAVSGAVKLLPIAKAVHAICAALSRGFSYRPGTGPGDHVAKEN
jgi:hypothetical protein